MMAGPEPKFSPRTVFTDHNYAGDAFLSGLGDANLVPLLSVVDGVKDGLAIAKDIQELRQTNSPEAVESRRIKLETEKANLKKKENDNIIGDIEARHKASSEKLQGAANKTGLETQIEKNEREYADIVLKGEATTILGQIKDPYSFKKALEDKKLGRLAGDKDIAEQVEAKAKQYIIEADSVEEKTELIKAAQILAPGSMQRLASIAGREVQQQLLDPIQHQN